VSDSASPASGHPFLDLGERLRQRGQLEAALSVALAGVARHPTLAAAHELVGRVQADVGDDESARTAWLAALECDPQSIGAHKGLAFLAFKRQDLVEAERRLEMATAVDPTDATLLGALDRVRATRPVRSDDTVQFDDPAAGLLLLDLQGLRLVGGLGPGHSDAAADAVAAVAVGAVREAGRTARLLDLGAWRHLMLEGPTSRSALLPIDGQGILVVHRPSAAPAGRVLALAGRAASAARLWLEQHG
jgi:predicted regulator of Ras-like GTPase activity (Roadblock/LC7/MglB family)